MSSRKSLLTLFMLAVICLAAVPSLLAQVTVTGANPSAAPPGTVNLNVTISGSGFKKNAKAQFFLTGTTNPGGVTVTSTAFGSSGQVVATINVSSDAVDASYDIQVLNTNGSSGKGTELFGVNKDANINGSNDHADVISTVYDVDTSNNPLLLHSDDYKGQQQATYSGADFNVTSQVFGFWQLDLSGQNTRAVWLTFSRPAGNSLAAPVPDGYYNARVMSKCFDVSNNIVDLMAMTAISINPRCSLRVEFTYSGTRYVFVMSPNGNYPGTGWATVTCKAANGYGCSSWSIVPTMENYVGNNPTVADLLSVNPRTLKETLIGTYHNTYRIDFTE